MPTHGDAVRQAAELMDRFAERTGLSPGRPPERYLWTDAFAVHNFLGLARATGDRRHAELALRLVDQVHHVLGRHRADDPRSGWISGLGKEEGEAHPTWGGLRIGKRLRERSPGVALDPDLEWDRDGQYFHYLTQWMHALDAVALFTREPRYNIWARELAGVAHDAFVYGSTGGRRMVWKMSTDLSRPLVSTMGHQDPLDGFVACVALRATATLLPGTLEGPGLEESAADFATMVGGRDFTTADPLGLGGLLVQASRLIGLTEQELVTEERLIGSILAGARAGLVHYERQGELKLPAARRLAFRELGLAIGLGATERLDARLRASSVARDVRLRARLEGPSSYAPLGEAIEAFWLAPEHREGPAWSEHRDINDVMLATLLLPEGFLCSPTDVAAESGASRTPGASPRL